MIQDETDKESPKKDPDIISTFESWMLTQGVISRGFDDPLPKERKGARRKFWHWSQIQIMFFGFGLRSFILLLLPLLPTKIQSIKWIPLLLGDHLYTLGLPMRQMWFALCFYYSFLCFILRVLIRRLDLTGKMTFITDYRFIKTKYAESSLRIPREGIEKLKKKMKFCHFIYRGFAISIYSTTFGNLAISLALQVYQTRSIVRALIGSFWITYQMFWVQNVVPLLCEVLFFEYLSCQVIEMRFAKVINDCLQKLKNRKQNLYASVLTCLGILKDLDHTCSKVAEYNLQVKWMLWYIYHIFVPTAATASYVIFTGEFPNWMSFALVLTMSINQLGLICSYLFFARTIARFSRSCFVSLFSIQTRHGIAFPVRLQVMIRKRIKHLTNKKFPVAFTCGDNFPITSDSFMEFIMNIITFVIMLLEAILNLQSVDVVSGNEVP